MKINEEMMKKQGENEKKINCENLQSTPQMIFNWILWYFKYASELFFIIIFLSVSHLVLCVLVRNAIEDEKRIQWFY